MNLFFYIKAICNRHNRHLWSQLLILSSFLGILLATLVTNSLYLNRLHQDKISHYGAFSHIIYDQEMQNQSHAFAKMTLGSSFLLDQMTVGTMDANAHHLSGLSLSPLSDGQAIISSQLAKEKGLRLGQDWQVADQRLKVVQIVPNIGLLWVRGASEVQLEMPQILVSEKTFEQLVPNLQGRTQIYLADFKGEEPSADWQAL